MSSYNMLGVQFETNDKALRPRGCDNGWMTRLLTPTEKRHTRRASFSSRLHALPFHLPLQPVRAAVYCSLFDDV